MNLNWNIEPMQAPRMTRADAWKKRPVVLKYRKFRDDVNELMKGTPLKEITTLRVDFYIPMAKSWSKKKRLEMAGTPHQQKPDIDNYIKGLLDAIFRDGDDCKVYEVIARKFWAVEGKIEIII
jgi:Holliday junction resolvase RusA-like endonuclease